MKKEWYTITLIDHKANTEKVIAKIHSMGLAYNVYNLFKTIYEKPALKNQFTLNIK